MEKLLEVALARLPESDRGEPLNPSISLDVYGNKELAFLIDKGIKGTKKYKFPIVELEAEIAAAKPAPKKKKAAKKPEPTVVGVETAEVKAKAPKATPKKADKKKAE